MLLLYTASSSIPYNVSTLSFISSVVATSSYNIYVTKTLNSFPHPLFIMFLQPHPVLLYYFLTSSSIPYVATTSSSTTLCCNNLILYYFILLQPHPQVISVATTSSSFSYVSTTSSSIPYIGTTSKMRLSQHKE